jgi:hypothetical protein
MKARNRGLGSPSWDNCQKLREAEDLPFKIIKAVRGR